MLSVFRKIGQTGLVANVRYAISPHKRRKLVGVMPTHLFDRHVHLMTEAETAAHFGSFELAENSMVLASSDHEVERVVDLT